MIDILAIQPHAIERGLAGKTVMIYSKPKGGKTTAACQFPKVLLCAFEKGYNMIGGVKPQDINSWSDWKLVIRQLRSDAAKQMYSTIVMDTVSIAWDMCEKSVCAANGVQKIGEIPWGQGWGLVKKEFEASLREITMLGYGLVLISHSKSRTEKDSEGNEFEIISPDLTGKASEVCNGAVDIIGYIGTEWKPDGTQQRWLYTRETPRLFAGSRLKYLAPKIKFGYDELCAAIDEAIQKEADAGTAVTDSISAPQSTVEELNYDQIREQAMVIWNKLVLNDPDNPNMDMAKRILKKAEMIFGHSIKLSEITEDQVELYNLLLLDMKDLEKTVSV